MLSFSALERSQAPFNEPHGSIFVVKRNNAIPDPYRQVVRLNGHHSLFSCSQCSTQEFANIFNALQLLFFVIHHS
jgi:hypothetical protein